MTSTTDGSNHVGFVQVPSDENSCTSTGPASSPRTGVPEDESRTHPAWV
jgi:hypothetical protein